MKKIAIISTHPIQYNAPWFAMLTQRRKIDLKVFYTWPQAIEGFDDPDFGTTVKWDIPLLDGYAYQFVENISPSPSSKSWKGIDNPTLIPEVEQYKPDAILIFGWKFKSHFSLMRHFKGKVPIWFRGDSTLLDYEVRSIKQVLFRQSADKANNATLKTHFSRLKSYLKFRIRVFILTLVYRYIDKAFYVGTNSKAYFLKHGLKENQLVFAPHAIENNRFFDSTEKQYEAKAKQWREELGIKETDKIILFVGKFEPKKNPLLLINAVQRKTDHSPLTTHNSQFTTHLLFAGSGPLEAELKRQASNNPKLHFLPFQNQSQMPIVYRLANIFCLPSQGPEETWGLAVNEALACGRPVLVSNKVGCAIDVVKQHIGRIFKSGDLEDLKFKLAELLQANISAPTCQKHIKDWSFEAICQSIEKELAVNSEK
jgi:glycosyltransferase involved in cell wall biosynthesis